MSEAHNDVLETISFHFDTPALKRLVLVEVQRRLKTHGLSSDHATLQHVTIADAGAFADIPINQVIPERSED